MNNREEQLQRMIESGGSDGSLDAHAYKKVFEALAKETGPELRSDFADRMVMMVEGSRVVRMGRFEWAVAIVGVFFSLILFIVAIVLTGFSPDLGFLKSAEPFKGILIFGVAFVLVLHTLEKFLLRKKLSS